MHFPLHLPPKTSSKAAHVQQLNCLGHVLRIHPQPLRLIEDESSWGPSYGSEEFAINKNAVINR